MNRKIIFYNSYFMDFYLTLDSKTQKKIDFVFDIIKKANNIPAKFFKSIEGSDGLYEIRVSSRGNIYRIFCFFDEGQIIVLVNTFQKKTQKTPKKEITLAERLKKEYFKNKKGGSS